MVVPCIFFSFGVYGGGGVHLGIKEGQEGRERLELKKKDKVKRRPEE